MERFVAERIFATVLAEWLHDKIFYSKLDASFTSHGNLRFNWLKFLTSAKVDFLESQLLSSPKLFNFIVNRRIVAKSLFCGRAIFCLPLERIQRICFLSVHFSEIDDCLSSSSFLYEIVSKFQQSRLTLSIVLREFSLGLITELEQKFRAVDKWILQDDNGVVVEVNSPSNKIIVKVSYNSPKLISRVSVLMEWAEVAGKEMDVSILAKQSSFNLRCPESCEKFMQSISFGSPVFSVEDGTRLLNFCRSCDKLQIRHPKVSFDRATRVVEVSMDGQLKRVDGLDILLEQLCGFQDGISMKVQLSPALLEAALASGKVLRSVTSLTIEKTIDVVDFALLVRILGSLPLLDVLLSPHCIIASAAEWDTFKSATSGFSRISIGCDPSMLQHVLCDRESCGSGRMAVCCGDLVMHGDEVTATSIGAVETLGAVFDCVGPLRKLVVKVHKEEGYAWLNAVDCILTLLQLPLCDRLMLLELSIYPCAVYGIVEKVLCNSALVLLKSFSCDSVRQPSKALMRSLVREHRHKEIRLTMGNSEWVVWSRLRCTMAEPFFETMHASSLLGFPSLRYVALRKCYQGCDEMKMARQVRVRQGMVNMIATNARSIVELELVELQILNDQVLIDAFSSACLQLRKLAIVRCAQVRGNWVCPYPACERLGLLEELRVVSVLQGAYTRGALVDFVANHANLHRVEVFVPGVGSFVEAVQRFGLKVTSALG